MRSGFLFLSVVLVFTSNGLKAQTNHYRFTRLDVNHGLSHNQVKTILKDSEGFVWIGTNSGLNRYDGYSLKVFRNHPDDSSSLISSDINEIFEAPEGKLWINTWTGPNIYDPNTEKFDRDVNKLLRRCAIPQGAITGIRKDSKGNYWFIHASRGLFVYNPGTRHTLRIDHSDEDISSIQTNLIASWAEDRQGKYLDHSHKWCFAKTGWRYTQGRLHQ